MDEPGGRPIEAFRDVADASEALYRSLVEQVPAVVYVDTNDPEPESLYVSPQSLEMLGHPPEAFLADRTLWTRSIHPDDRRRVAEAWSAAVERQDPWEFEYRWMRPDGEVVWVRDGAVLIRDADGHALFWQGVMYDITRSKTTEEGLRESESRYRLLVENIPAVVYMVAPDDDRRTLFVTPQIERALGYSRKEWLDQPDIWMELLHPDDRERTLDAHDRHNETGEPWNREYRLIAADGRAVWVRDVARLVGDGPDRRWLGVQLDITELKGVEAELRAARDDLERRVAERTAELEEANALMSLEIAERRRAEQELRVTEHRYRTLAEHIPAVTYLWAVEREDREPDRGAYTSPRIEQMLGYTVDEWHASDDFWISRLHPDDRAAVLAATIRSETTGEPFGLEYRYLHKDGRIVWVFDEAVLLSRDEQGRPSAFQGVMMDVTAAKEAERKANETDVRYRSLAEHVPAVIYLVDLMPGEPDDRITYLGPQITSILGHPTDVWPTSAEWLAMVHPLDRDRVAGVVAHVAETGGQYAVEYRVRHAGGGYRWVRDQGSVISHDVIGRPKEAQGLLIDMTAAKRAEQERAEAQARYRSLVEQIPAVTYIELPTDDPEALHLVYVSPQAERILGRSPEELMADPDHLVRMLHPDDRDAVIAVNAHSDRTGDPFDAEYRIVRDDGEVVWLHSRATLVRDDRGEPLFWHGVALDVTRERRTEADLRELEERYRRLTGRLVDLTGEDGGSAGRHASHPTGSP